MLEITALSLVAGLSSADFITANEDINAYLRRQPGFRWRRIVEADDGRVVDIVAYDSRERALAGAAGITGEMGDSPVHATIDHGDVDWQLTTVLQLVTADR
nr:hypothetical protein [Angustibacter sp. Root456]